MAADLFGDWALAAGDVATAALVGTAIWAGRKAAREAHAAWEQASNEQRMMVLAVLNFYELIATEYNADAIDRASADLYLSYAAVTYWSYVEPLVGHLRSQDGSFYAEWKHLVDRHGERIRTTAHQHLISYESPSTAAVAAAAPAAAEAPPAGEEHPAGSKT